MDLPTNIIVTEEIETIASVFSFSAHNKKKVHIIATHWDTMNQPVEDWEKQKQYLRSKLCSKAYFDTIEDAESNIMPSAAFIYNICRDIKLLNKNEKNPLYAFLMIDCQVKCNKIREKIF